MSVGVFFLNLYLSLNYFYVVSWQRFARADKRAEMPKRINQFITETASNLSTDMALVLSKLFMRQISQNANENQTGGLVVDAGGCDQGAAEGRQAS